MNATMRFGVDDFLHLGLHCWYMKTLGSLEKRILEYLKDERNKVYPPATKIARDLSVYPQSADRAIRSLKRKGYLE